MKGILRSKQNDEPLTGISTGRKGSKHRYYRINRCESVKPTDDKTVSEIVDQTVAAIHDLAPTLTDAPPTTLRQFLNVLISRLVVGL